MKSLSVFETWNNLTPPLLFVTSPFKCALQDTDFYDQFEDRFQDLSKVKNLAVSKANVYYILGTFKRKCFGGYDAVTLTMLYLNVVHDMVSQTSSWFFRSFHQVLEIYVLNIRKLPNLAAVLEIFWYVKNKNFVEHV